MELMVSWLGLGSFITALAGLFFISIHIDRYFETKRTSPKTPRALTVDAKQLLHDLTNGGAIVKIVVIDPDGLMIYRGCEDK